MKKLLLLVLALISMSGCDGLLNNIQSPENPDEVDPYTTGDRYIVTYTQNYDKSFHIQIKDEDRLLSDRYFGQFSDPDQTSKTIEDEIILPSENRTYTIYEEYKDEEVPLNIIMGKGLYINITYLSTGVYVQQSVQKPQPTLTKKK